MILHLKNSVAPTQVEAIAKELKAFHVQKDGKNILITGSGLKEVPAQFESSVADFWVFPNDMQLSSKKYLSEKRSVKIGNIEIGGATNNTVLIGGPCSVESEEQIRTSSELLKELGLTTLRGGCYKPRTSPYSFQGMGLEGLKLLAKMRDEYGLNVITEVRDASHIDEVIEYSDVIQVGAKAMYDQGILRACAKTTKPVLGIPLGGGDLDGMDSLLATVQMPKGVPVATFAIGKSGAINAALCAVQMLGTSDEKIAAMLVEYKSKMHDDVLAANESIQ